MILKTHSISRPRLLALPAMLLVLIGIGASGYMLLEG